MVAIKQLRSKLLLTGIGGLELLLLFWGAQWNYLQQDEGETAMSQEKDRPPYPLWAGLICVTGVASIR